MSEILATNVVASRLPERRPTGTPTYWNIDPSCQYCWFLEAILVMDVDKSNFWRLDMFYSFFRCNQILFLVSWKVMDCDTQEIGCNSFITKPKREFPLLSKCLMLYWCWCCSHWNFIVDCIQNDQIKLGIKDVFTVSKTTHPCFFQVVFYCEVFSILRLSFDWRLIMIFDVVCQAQPKAKPQLGWV